MTISSEGVLEIERRISAPRETVFLYFTDPDRYRKWQGVDAELDPRPGGIFRVSMTGRSRTVATGRFVEVQPPERLVFTWGWEFTDGIPEGMDGPQPGASTVEVVFLADGPSATILRLRHSGLSNQAVCDFHSAGWKLGLDRLVVVAEGGDPGPYPFAEF